MIGDLEQKDEADIDEDAVEATDEDTIVIDTTDDSDNVGDMSVEINVDELVAKIESEDDDSARKADVRKRIDELQEQRDSASQLDSTYNFNLDDDL